MAHSDVDIIADFPETLGVEAAGYAEQLCIDRQLKPDIRPSIFVSDRFVAEVSKSGVVLE